MPYPITKNHSSKVKTDVRKRSYHFSLAVIKFVSKLPNESLYWVFRDQLLRSATSVGANLAEAKGSNSKKEFIRYFEISLKSANETKYWLDLLKESELVDSSKVDPLIREIIELCNMIASSLLTMRGKR